MIIDLIVTIATLICGIAIGFYLGVDSVRRRASDGTCIRTDDREVYLRLSETGQEKLSDPSTKLLFLRVVDVSTRNNHLL